MKLYLTCGLTFMIIGVIWGLMWFSHRAGYSAARLKTQLFCGQAGTSNITALQKALKARTNGIRDKKQLIEYLNRGIF